MLEIPGPDDYDLMLKSRHGREAQARFASAKVAVAGLGGLGSQVALALARAGVGHLLLVDFDVVELSNLGRQAYFLRHLGLKKTTALTQMIAEINPYLKVESLDLKLTTDNIPRALEGWPIIVEALDQPESKAELVAVSLAAFPQARVVCASGVAGLHSPNLIRSRQVAERWYLCGDETNEAGRGESLMAARVMICAGHQATVVLRLLMEMEQV